VTEAFLNAIVVHPIAFGALFAAIVVAVYEIVERFCKWLTRK
jgi:hypothetical protein